MLDTPTVSRIPTEDPAVYAFEIRPGTRAGDIEAMAAVVNAAFERDEKISMLLRLTGIDMGDAAAGLSPQSLKAQTRSPVHIEKYAVIGAPAPAKAMIKMTSPLVPVDARVFAPEDEEGAWAFVGTRPSEG